ncbi:MAG: RDD family protein [Desulfuromusa sp.]|nr:RDD family protein [Desulfuromusa sp.]
MRCPKCGYNSFDHLDSCKKCGKDLVEFKQSFGIRSVLFPGQEVSDGVVGEAEFDDTAADVAVSAATGAAVTAAASDGGSPPTGADGDDFGFDFMGDSADDDDLSFDELFEEAPEDEDIEETIEGPKGAKVADDVSSDDVFSFDLPEDEADLEGDFGFDPEDEEPESPAGEPEDSGSEEDPQRPFDLPESSQFAGAPEDRLNILKEQPSPVVTAGESVNLPLGDAGLTPEELPESYVFELDETPAPPPAPVESPAPVFATSDSVAEVTAPSSVTVTSVVTQVVQDDLPDDVVTGIVVPPPPLLSCVNAFICDLILLVFVGISFVLAAEAAMATGGAGFLPSLETLINLSIPYFLVLFFLAFGYFTLFHFLVGQTPGKMLMGLRVETTEGEALAFAQAFLRSVGGLFQLLPVGLGYLVVLSNSERRGWNDRLAGTRVVNLRNLSGEN